MIELDDNLFIGRLDNGDVRLLKLKCAPLYPPKVHKPYFDKEMVELDQVVHHRMWCRAISHVSVDQHDHDKWYAAMAFHMGARP